MVTLEAAVGDRYGIGETIVVPDRGERTICGNVENAPAAAQAWLLIGNERIPVGRRWEYALRPAAATRVRVELPSAGRIPAVTNPIHIDVQPANARRWSS